MTLPLVNSVRSALDKAPGGFTVCLPGLVATGQDERELAGAVDAVRKQIAFYGATPAYRAVLDLHGWGELHTELHRLSRLGEWDTMPGLVDDQVLNAFAVVGAPVTVAKEIYRRHGDLLDRFTLYTPYPMAEAVRRDLVGALHACG